MFQFDLFVWNKEKSKVYFDFRWFSERECIRAKERERKKKENFSLHMILIHDEKNEILSDLNSTNSALNINLFLLMIYFHEMMTINSHVYCFSVSFHLKK